MSSIPKTWRPGGLSDGMRSLTRSLAFVRKELVSVWRQPRLIATLVLGPFLILLLFGLGYQEMPEPFRTVIVAEQTGATIGVDPDELDEAFGEGIDLVDVTDDLDSARASLVAGEIDLVLVAPEDGLAALQRGSRPPSPSCIRRSTRSSPAASTCLPVFRSIRSIRRCSPASSNGPDRAERDRMAPWPTPSTDVAGHRSRLYWSARSPSRPAP